MAKKFIGSDTDYIVNGVDQRTVAEQNRARKEKETKVAADIKNRVWGRALAQQPKSPGARDVETGNVRTSGGVTPATKTVNKVYRPSK